MRFDSEEMKKFSENFKNFQKNPSFYYVESWSKKFVEISELFSEPVAIAAAMRLWSPGIMTPKDITEITGITNESKIKIELNRLVDADILNRLMGSLYTRGEFGGLFMDMFAWMMLEGNLKPQLEVLEGFDL